MANGCVVDEALGEDRIEVVVPNLAQENLIGEVVVRYLHRRRVHVVEYDKIPTVENQSHMKRLLSSCQKLNLSKCLKISIEAFSPYIWFPSWVLMEGSFTKIFTASF